MDQISTHAARVWLIMADRKWHTNTELSASLAGLVAPRTVRAYTKCFVDNEVAEVAEVFPEYRYRRLAGGDTTDFGREMTRAAVILGLDIVH